jgi:ESX secretion system protein EccC
MHLVVASQRAGDARLLALGDQSTIRIAMRTVSEADSVAVLGTTGAAHLPSAPGYAYLRSEGSAPVRFRAAFVSSRRPAEATGWTGILHEVAFPSRQDTELAATVRRLAALDPPVRRFHLGYELHSATLGDELGPAAPTPDRGFQAVWEDRELTRSLPVAVSDAPVWVPIDQPVIIAGPPGSRRTIALETLVCGLALTRTPEEAEMVLLALDNGGLMRLAELPHVSLAGNLTTAGRIYHLFALIRSWLRQSPPARPVFLIIDGLDTLLRFFPDLRPLIDEMYADGPDRRIHPIVAVTEPITSAAGMLVDLHDAEPLLPTIPADDRPPGSDAEEIARLANRYWTGPRHPPRSAPDPLRYADLAATPPRNPMSYVVGEELLTGDPLDIDFTSGPGLLAVGGRGSGKTALVRLLATSIVRRHRSDGGARLVIIDPKRSLAGLPDLDDAERRGMVLRAPTGTAAEHRRLIADLAEALRDRLPKPHPEAEAFRGRRAWSAAEIFVLVDDLDELDGRGSTLRLLAPYLPKAHELGLHLIVTHAMVDRERLMGDEVTRSMIELDATQVLMSGTQRPAPVLGDAIPIPLPPLVGRLIVPGGGVRTVQFAYLPFSGAEAT